MLHLGQFVLRIVVVDPLLAGASRGAVLLLQVAVVIVLVHPAGVGGHPVTGGDGVAAAAAIAIGVIGVAVRAGPGELVVVIVGEALAGGSASPTDRRNRD